MNRCPENRCWIGLSKGWILNIHKPKETDKNSHGDNDNDKLNDQQRRFYESIQAML